MSNNVNLAQVIALINSMSGGSSGGTSDYGDLKNKPQIDGIELSGNKSLADLGYPIFYWNGKGSDTDSSVIELWKKITQYGKIRPVLVVVKYDSTYSGIMIIDKDFFFGSSTTKYPRTSLAYITTSINTSGHTYTFTENKNTIRTDISVLGEDIISVRKSYVVSNVLRVLDAGAIDDVNYFKPTKKSQPVSKGFLDDRINERVIVYFWDGQSTDINSENFIMWKDIQDKLREGKQPIIILNNLESSNKANGLPIIIPRNSWFGTENYSLQYKCSPTHVTSTTMASNGLDGLNIYYTYINVVGVDGEVSSVSKIYSSSASINTLPINYLNSYPEFVPTKPNHPANKKYVDEQIGNIGTILDTLNGEVI